MTKSKRGRPKGYEFSDDDLFVVLWLYAMGYTIKQISVVMKISYGVLYKKLKRIKMPTRGRGGYRIGDSRNRIIDLDEAKELRRNKYTFQEIADKFNVSRQAVHKLLKDHDR